ncbi:YukJ family protein [Bacillus wiedmannii]|uniref:YukJ family protein n=1 Tax=Bacillus wiedmannii TaxID=1890302 RepID=UPI0021D08CC4|nr:YukJ family protein [Bacillus wiedmannii]MCU5681300.1 YukJ family protein [Bacillus wiedmannii]
MPLKNYGVLKGTVIQSKIGKGKTPHYQVHLQGETGVDYRIAINVKSQSYPSEVLYFASNNIRSEAIHILPTLPFGFTEVKNNEPKVALDYVRGNLFDSKQMIPLPPEKAGTDNDLNEKIERYIKRAIEEKATIYAFGERWGPEENTPDSYFHFKPGNGIHDIHMNQGNVEKWKGDNGIWQDGGILIHFEKEEEWIGIFLAFQSQSWCTDEEGHARIPVEHCDYKGNK